MSGKSSFVRLAHPWEYRIISLILLGLYGLLVWMSVQFPDPARLFSVISLGVLVLFGIGLMILPSFQRITVGPEGITLSLWRFTLRKIPFADIRTVVKDTVPSGRTPLTVLLVSTVPVKEMEAEGERNLRKDPLIREELKFREDRSDWGDVCLGAAFYRNFLFMRGFVKQPFGWKGTIWMEFSPERQALLQEQFPHAQHREAKRYYDPPNPT